MSAYTHPTWSGYETIDRERGHPSMWGGRPRSHCLGELTLLYAATFAVGELRSFAEFVDQRPGLVERTNRADIDDGVAGAEAAASHVWYPGGQPSEYDRFQEVNRRVWTEWRAHPDTLPAAPEMASIPAEEIAYYRDPLRRLIDSHSPTSEMTTGCTYRPPWW